MKSTHCALLLMATTLLSAGAAHLPIDKNHSSAAFHVPIMNGMAKFQRAYFGSGDPVGVPGIWNTLLSAAFKAKVLKSKTQASPP